MKIMESRYQSLVSALEGLKEVSVPLVGKAGGIFGVANLSDDEGIYVFIPWIARFFGISIDNAINLFLGFLLVTGLGVGYLCFHLLFKKTVSRLMAFFGLTLLGIAAYRFSDVYIVQMFAVTVIVPPALLIHQKGVKFKGLVIGFLALAGLIVGYANLTRSQSGTSVFFFLILWTAFQKPFYAKEKIYSFLILVLFALIPLYHFKHLDKERDEFLVKNNPSYQPISVAHPLWHALYLGLGYRPNSYGIEWNDTFAWEKVKSVDPKAVYLSDEYNRILKEQYLSILKNDPGFVARNFLLKSLRVGYYFLLFFNFGLLAYFYVKPTYEVVLPFLPLIFWAALPGVLIMPASPYLLGMISAAAIFGIYLTGFALDQYFMKRKKA